MRPPMVPTGFTQVWARIRQYPLPALLIVAALVWGASYLFQPAVAPVPPQQVKTQPLLPEQKVTPTVQKHEWATIQQTLELAQNAQRANEQAVVQLRAALLKSEQERATRDAQLKQEIDAKVRQALDAQATKMATAPRDPKPAAAKTVTKVVREAAPPPAPEPPPTKPVVGTLQVAKGESQGWPGITMPLSEAARADTAYIPASSHADIMVVGGVFASQRRHGQLPVSVAVKGPFYGPHQLHGPGQRPTPTRVEMQGCMLLGVAEANLGSGRVEMTFYKFICVFPDKETLEKDIKGYVLGKDGTLGIPGEYEDQSTAYVARMALTSLIAGAGEALALAKRTVIVNPFGGTTTTVNEGQYGAMAGLSALSRAAADISTFYKEQAERLMPVLRAASGARGSVVLLEGIVLEGYPTQILIAQGGE